MRRTTRYIALAAVVVWAGTWTVAYGQTGNCYLSLPGCLDPTFGSTGNGLVTTPSVRARADDVAIQTVNSEQRILAVGTEAGTWLIARYLPDGALDTTFGVGGFVRESYKSNPAALYAVAVQPDGKVLVAGSVPYGKPTVTTLAVARYLPNGVRDKTFGSGGLVTVPLLIFTNKTPGFANDIAIQPDGKIVVVGQAGYLVVAIRLTSAGVLDKTFGNSSPKKDGKFIYRAAYGAGPRVAFQSDGGIVIAGWMFPLTSSDTFRRAFVMRLTPGGELDTNFAGSGVTTLGLPSSHWYFTAVAVDPSDRIIAAGYWNYWDVLYESQALFARYQPNGYPDPTFGTDGIVMRQWAAENWINDMILQPDGRILATGSTHPQFSLWRLMESGTPDPTFGSTGDGWVTASFPETGELGQGGALALQSDGKVLVGTSIILSQGSRMALLRYFQ